MQIKKRKKLCDFDLEKMTAEDYKIMKDEEMAEMQEYVNAIDVSTDITVMYKKGRACTDLKQMLETSAKLFGDKVLYHQIMPGDDNYTEISYNQVLRDVQGLGTALIGLGLKGAHIGVVGQNCYEWAESYQAVIGGTGIVLPLDKELSQEEHEVLCQEGDIKAVICCSDKYYDMFKDIKDKKKTGLKYIIGVNKEKHENPKKGLYSWNLLREEGLKKLDEGDRSFVDARIRNTDMAAIIFTSGTTGVAKGVMLSHKNLCFDVLTAQTYLEVLPSDIFFSVLPIHHTYECTCTMIEGMYMGASMAFGRGLKYITKDMQLVKPTFLLAVPLIYEKFYNSIQKTLKKQGKLNLVNTLFSINKVTSKVGINVSKPVVGKIMGQFGGRIRMFIAGGAKVDPEVLSFFRNLGIKTLQGYGLTETSPMVALNPDQWKFMRNDSAGKLLQFTECKIIDKDEDGNGEICFRGGQVMLGYYKNPEATEKCMIDGWFHTGDLGHIDDDNYVYITGRKKNVIIASNGKNVFPEELEEKVNRSRFIEESMVWASDETVNSTDKGIHITLRVDKENVAEELGDKAEDEQAVYDLISNEIDKYNKNAPVWKRISHIIIKKGEFNKTTGMKIKRFVDENKTAE
ncbi:MAG: AMP-binding protein [Clostridiales bacterium]|nr:AMP-binding protein [Clostridiales bacterium]